MNIKSLHPVTFRPLMQEDEPLLREMLYHAIYVPPHMPPPERGIVDHPHLAVYVKGWGRVGDGGIAAIDPDRNMPVGAAWLRLMMGTERGYGYVDDRTPELSIAVLPEYRGQGIGTQMLEQLLQAAQTKHPAVSLSVSIDNPARRLYERLGFRMVSVDDTSLIMKIDLAR